MSANTAVVRAAQMFTKHGKSKEVNLPMELAIGASLGLVAGLVWKTHHWNEKRKIAEYYHTLAKIQAQPKDADE